MAVLQVLVYPGIARLISAFQYHGSAFLVLEYAKHGDLHSHLVKYGKLESALLR
jgi:serine/threonine protein kinase